jgi:hypothetical protein
VDGLQAQLNSISASVGGSAVASAARWTTARTLSLSGDVSGAVSITGANNVSLSCVVANNSHTHTIANISSLQATLNSMVASTNTKPTLLQIYPVGCIYTSVTSTNPGSLFGGSWVAFGAGRVLVGIDGSQSEFDSVNETGGAKTHTLSVSEIPAHTHTYEWENSGGSGYSPGAANGDSSLYSKTSGSTGGGAAHNNLQPYVVVYMFRRTA